MMGLVYKDIMVQGRTLRYYLIFMLVYVVLVFAGVFDTFILGTFAVVMAMLLPMSSMAYDDQVKWDAYAAAAPGGRKRWWRASTCSPSAWCWPAGRPP